MKRAFSMVELLVVIAIVAVLLSLLMPTLGKAREQAKAVVCLSQQRGLFPGFTTYTAEHKNYWVVNGNQGHTILWSRIVTKNLGLKYVGEQNVNMNAWTSAWTGQSFQVSDGGYGAPLYSRDLTSLNRKNLMMKCPSENFKNNWGGENATSYRFNSGFTYFWGLGVSDEFTLSLDPNERAKGRIKDQEILKPFNTFVIADGIPSQGVNLYEYQQEGLNTVLEIPSYHNGGANLLWADGHASFMLKDDVLKEHFDRRQ